MLALDYAHGYEHTCTPITPETTTFVSASQSEPESDLDVDMNKLTIEGDVVEAGLKVTNGPVMWELVQEMDTNDQHENGTMRLNCSWWLYIASSWWLYIGCTFSSSTASRRPPGPTPAIVEWY